MTASHHDLVAEFAHTFGHPIETTPVIPSKKLRRLRTNLLREEYAELVAAADARDIIEVADATADIPYIAHGTLHAYGLRFNPQSVKERPGLATAMHWYLKAEREAGQSVGGALNMMQTRIGILLNIIIVEVKAITDAYGIPYDEVFREVHASNMSKLGLDGKPITRADGKTLKGPNFFEPRIAPILIDAGHTVTVAA